MNLLKINSFFFFLFFCSICWSVTPLEFQTAALMGDYTIIEKGLKEKSYEYVRLRDKDQNTPLHLAAYAKQGGEKVDIITLLLKSGADVNATNCHLYTPIHIAISTNNVEGSKRLLKEHNIELNSINTANTTPLIYAIAIRSTELINLLLAHSQINPNQENTDGLTPLHLAAKWGYDKELELLLNHERINPAPKQSQGDFIGATPLHYAAMQSYPSVIKLLLKQKMTNVNEIISNGLYQGFTPVHFAVMHPDVYQVFECLKLLIIAGANVKKKTKNGKLPSDLTNVEVILQFLNDPNPSYELKRKTDKSS